MIRLDTWSELGVAGRRKALIEAERGEDGVIALAKTCGSDEMRFLSDLVDDGIMPRWTRMTRKETKAFLCRFQATEGREGWFDCAICGGSHDASDGQNATLDHGAPRSDVVFNNIQNVMLVCRRCNARRGNRYTISETRSQLRSDGASVDIKAAVWAIQRVQRMVILIMRLEALHELWLLPDKPPAI